MDKKQLHKYHFLDQAVQKLAKDSELSEAPHDAPGELLVKRGHVEGNAQRRERSFLMMMAM